MSEKFMKEKDKQNDQSKTSVRYNLLSNASKLPSKTALGYDVFSAEKVDILPGKAKKVSTGLVFF